MGLVLGGVEFGRVWNAAGGRNFFGEGYPYHRWLGPLRPRFGGATFVAKTTTVEPRPGNMPLDGTTPREAFPACIRVNFRRAAVLNAVGLAGPGLAVLLADGRWQARREPFLLSFMAVGATFLDRLAEYRRFGRMVGVARGDFRAPFGVEVNCSCPNVGADPADLVAEVKAALTTLDHYLPGVPLVPKFSVLTPVDAAAEVAAHPDCAAVCVSNSLPWGSLPDRVDWPGLFGATSPLARFGGGGLSGAPLFPLVCEWARDAMVARFPRPVVAGGGVMSWADAAVLRSYGAAAVELGSIAIVRPWRVAGVVDALK